MSATHNRIVVAVGPDTSADAVEVAFGVAAERGAPLLAVRAWHDPDLPLGGWLGSEPLARWDAAHRAARSELDGALERARAAHPAVEVTTVVVDDDPMPFLLALSTEAQLLVLGRSRHPGHRPCPVDALVRQAACPVLVVPGPRRAASAPVHTLVTSGG